MLLVCRIKRILSLRRIKLFDTLDNYVFICVNCNVLIIRRKYEVIDIPLQRKQ